MSLIQKTKHFIQSGRVSSVLYLTAIIFVLIGNGHGIGCLCFQTLIEAFIKALLVESMSTITWNSFKYIGGDYKRRGYVLIILVAIHVVWIFMINLCFTCLLRIEIGVPLLELFILPLMGAIIYRHASTVIKEIVHHFSGVLNPQDKTQHPEMCIPSKPVRDETHTASIPRRGASTNNAGSGTPQGKTQHPEMYVPSNPVRDKTHPVSSPRRSASTNNEGSGTPQSITVPSETGIPSNSISKETKPESNPRVDPCSSKANSVYSILSGLPFCQHLKKQNTHQIPPAPPNEGPPLNAEFETHESKTRSGKIYKVKLNRR